MEKRDFTKVSRTRPEETDFVYGTHAVEETLQSGRPIERVLMQRDSGPGFTNILKLVKAMNVPITRVPNEKLNGITKRAHQGVICFIATVPFANLEDVVAAAYEEGKDPLIIILDRVTDVRNFGAIARSAECAGATAIVIPMKNSARLGSDAMKTSAGALNYIPVCRVDNLHIAVKDLKNSGVRVVSCTEKAKKTLYETQLSGPLAIILGSEDEGIADNLLHLSNELASIPMAGQVNSLNVSVAAGVAIFETMRQRSLSVE